MAALRSSAACQRCLRLLQPAETLLRSTLRPFTTRPQPVRPWRISPVHSSAPRRTVAHMTRPEDGGPPPPPSELAQANQPRASPLGAKERSDAEENHRVLLQRDNLFHPMDKSPVASMRQRAAMIKKTAYCPHPRHRDPNETPHVSFTCPDCGVPTYCSAEDWAADYENHLLICDTLREANEDDHDLRSGRFFPEFEYPGEQIEEQLINMTNWDTLLYTRNFTAINDERQQRQVTKLLTYPITIASVLHELSPYSLRHRLTKEGLRSMSGKLRPGIHGHVYTNETKLCAILCIRPGMVVVWKLRTFAQTRRQSDCSSSAHGRSLRSRVTSGIN